MTSTLYSKSLFLTNSRPTLQPPPVPSEKCSSFFQQDQFVDSKQLSRNFWHLVGLSDDSILSVSVDKGGVYTQKCPWDSQIQNSPPGLIYFRAVSLLAFVMMQTVPQLDFLDGILLKLAKN